MSPHNFEGSLNNVDTINSAVSPFSLAPCMPNNLMLNPKNSSCVTVSWMANNRAANYTVSANGDDDKHICSTNESSCDITDLSCGSTYEVSVEANSTAGQSLPSYSEFLETGEQSNAATHKRSVLLPHLSCLTLQLSITSYVTLFQVIVQDLRVYVQLNTLPIFTSIFLVYKTYI